MPAQALLPRTPAGVLRIAALFAACTATMAVRADELPPDRQQHWHQWRGPFANGLAPHADPPVTWDAETNIRWKSAVPGAGSATPILWGDRIFVLSALETDEPAD